jgi:branched-chain amino acid transport system substrate-binding protein
MKKRHLIPTAILLALVGAGCGPRVDAPTENAASIGAPDAGSLAASSAGTSDPGLTTNTPVADSGTGAQAVTPGADTSSGGSTATPSAGTASPQAVASSGAGSAKQASAAASPSGSGQTATTRAGTPTAQGSAQPAARTAASPGGTPAPVPGGGQAGDGSPVAVGWIGTQSGTVGAIGKGMPAAVRAWVQDANSRGGLNGHPIKLIMVDDSGDPNRSVSLARRMIEQDGVIFFLGAFAPTTQQALIPLLEEKQVPIVSTCGCSPSDDSSPLVFPIGPSGDTGTAWAHILPMLKGHVAQEKLQKVGLLYCREVPSCPHMRELIRSYQEAAGFKLVWEAQASLAAPDFTAEMLSAKNAGVQALTMIMDNSSVVRIERSAKQQGFAPQFVNQQSGHEDRVAKEADVEGHITAATTAPWDSSPKMKTFRDAMDKYQPKEVRGSWGAQAFVAGLLLEKLSKNFSPKPTSADVLNGLYSLKGETVEGRLPPLTFVKGAKTHATVNLCVIPLQIKGGAFKTLQGEEFTCAPGWKPA